MLANVGLRYEELRFLDADDLTCDDAVGRFTLSLQPKELSDSSWWSPKSYQERTVEIDPDTYQSALAWIAWKANVHADHDWSRGWSRCRACNGTHLPHRARGLCRTCYGRLDHRKRRGLATANDLDLLEADTPRTDVSWKGLDKVLRAACVAAGVERITLHDFRRLRITRLHQQGWAIEAIRDFIGHESCRTTERYLRALGAIRAPHRAVDAPPSTDQRAGSTDGKDGGGTREEGTTERASKPAIVS